MSTMKEPNISMRILTKGLTLTAYPDEAVHADPMEKDVMKLAWKWLDKLDIPLRTAKVNGARFEFLTSDTLAYIEALEGILEDLQSDPETSDEVLEQIERVLK